VVTAETNARGLSAGLLFKVTDARARRGQDAVPSSSNRRTPSSRWTSTAARRRRRATYKCNIRAINSKNHFRPGARPPTNRSSRDPQSAIVVGKLRQGRHRQYGRVKVQFHWTRDGKSNESRLVLVRVSQNSAGANWGSLFLPHIGQEVLVSFMEGDP